MGGSVRSLCSENIRRIKDCSIFFSCEAIHPLSYEVIRYFISPSIPRSFPTFLFHSSLRLEGHPTEFLFSSRVIFLSFILLYSFIA
jgi:hypothetical protein